MQMIGKPLYIAVTVYSCSLAGAFECVFYTLRNYNCTNLFVLCLFRIFIAFEEIILSFVAKRFPIFSVFSFGKRKKSTGAKSAEYGAWGMIFF